MSTITISSGSSISNYVVSSGTIENILSGGLASNSIVLSGGSEDVSGTSISATIDTSGVQLIAPGGVANGAIISGGLQTVAGGTANNSVLVSGVLAVTSGGLVNSAVMDAGIMNINSGGVVSAAIVSGGTIDDSGLVVSNTIYSGATQFVLSGAAESGSKLLSGATEIVNKGGVANNDLINSGAGEQVQSGGFANGDILSGGFLAVSGVTSGTRVYNGGNETIYSGGVESNASVYSGGAQTIQSGGVVSGVTVFSGGVEQVSGIVNNITVSSGGTLNLASGGQISGGVVYSGGIVSGLILNSGSLNYSGGSVTIDGITVQSGATIGLIVGSGAAISGFTISGETFNIGSGSVASGLTVNSGGIENNSGSAAQTTVNSGGTENVYSGGVESGATVNSGGNLNLSGGTLSGGIVESGGTLTVSTGGTDNGTTITSGGNLIISAGGIVSGANLQSGANLTLQSGGEFIGTIVESGSSVGGLIVTSGSLTATSGGFQISGTVKGGAANVLEIGSGAQVSGLTDSGLTYKIDKGGAASAIVIGSAGVENVYGSDTGAIINSGGVENVYSGGVESGATANSGGALNVYGGIASGVTVESGATLTVASGGVENGGSIASGGTLTIGSGGVVSGVTLANGAHLNILSGGELIGTAIESGNPGGLDLISGSIIAVSGGYEINGAVVGGTAGVLEIGSGALVSGLTDTGLTFKIDAGGVASSVTLASTGVENVSGAANLTIVNSGGVENVYSGGVDSGAIINSGGNEYVSGGVVNAATVNSGATLTVLSGGVDNGSTILSGGSLVVSNGAVVSGVNVAVGANVTLQSGGTINGVAVGTGTIGGVDLTSGSLTATSGGFILSGTIVGATSGVLEVGSGALLSGFTDSSLTYKIDLGGVASSIVLSGSGIENVYGTANATTINAGTVQNIYSGGVDSGSTINSGGIENVSGGTVNADNVGGNATLTIYSAGTDNGSFVQNGGSENVSGGHVNGVTVENGGTLTVFTGTASGSIVQNGGSENVSGGVVYATTVESGGSLNIFSGAVDSGSVLNGGFEVVSSGGSATGVTVESGGYLTVNSGGIANGAAIDNGGVVEYAGSVTSGVSVSFGSGSGALVLDKPTGFAGAIQGFGAGDTIDIVKGGHINSVSWSNNVLSVVTTLSGTINLALVGNYSADTFTTTSDQLYNGGTDINLSVPVTPNITSTAYNAATGVLTLTGSNLTTSAANYLVTDFTLTGKGNSSYTLTGGSSITGSPTSSSVSIQLSTADQTAIDALLNKAGTTASDGVTYNLAAATGWDTGAPAVTTEGITVSTPSISSVSYNAATGGLSVSGAGLTSTAGSYTVNDFTLKGEGGATYTLSNGSTISGTPTSTGFNIQLSTADQLAVDGLLNHNGTTANGGATYNLSAIAGWDTQAPAIATEAVTVSNVTVPSISSVSYNAATGVFTVSGGNLVNAGSSNGIALADFTVSGGSGSYTFSASNDSVGNLTATGFTVTLSATDKAAVNAFVNANGSGPSSGAAYNFSATANWDSNSGNAISTQAVSVNGYAPTLSGVAYNEATGVLTLSGANFTTSKGDYIVTDFTFKGEGGNTYTLSNSSVITGTPTAGGVTIQLSAADQVALNGLFDSNGSTAKDGVIYNLSAPAGWDTPAGVAITSETFIVSNVAAPSISAVSYDAATGVFTVTGSNFSNLGSATGISLADFALTGGTNGSYTFSASNDSVSNLSATSFNITLSSADKSAVNAFVNNNGSSPLNGGAYNFTASANWDSGNGAVISTQAVSVNSVSSLTLASVAYNAATGVLTLSGSNLTTSAGDYTVTDFTLKGDNGSSYTLSSSSSISGTPTSTGLSIQLSAADQLAVDGLLNKNGLAANSGATYNLSATAGWDTQAPAISTEAVTVSNVTAPTISTVRYDAATGVFTVTGSNLDNAGSSNGISLKDFTITGDNSGSYTFSASNDTVSSLSAAGFAITLSSSDRTTVNTLLDANGSNAIGGSAYNLSATANWDSDSGSAVTTKAITVSGQTPVLTGTAYNAATGVLTLTGANLTTSAGDYTVTDFTLKGDGGVSYTLTGGSINGTPTSTGLSIQLSTADQLAVDGLLNNSGTTANSGATYNLSATAGWDTAAKVVTTEAITVSNVGAPSISNVVYDAATGVFTITGSDFSNHGGSNGIALADFTLSAGSSSYSFSASNDSVSNLSASAFTVTLSSADQLAVNAFVNANGGNTLGNAAYTFSGGGSWDSNSGSAFTSSAVTVNGVPPTLTGVNYNAATGILSLSGHNLTTASANYNVSDFTLSGDGSASYSLTSGSAISGTPTSSSVSIQLSAADQVAIDGLLNKDGTAANSGATYNLAATAGWDTAGAAISTEAVTVSNVTVPTISTVGYNATTGILSVAGANLSNHGSSNGIAIGDFKITAGALGKSAGSSLTLSASNDTVTSLTSSGFSLKLGIADKEALDLFVKTNGVKPTKGAAYNLSVATNWDSDSGSTAISTKAVTVSNVQPNLDTASYNYTTGKLTVTGNYLTSSGYKIADLSLSGDSGKSYTLSSGSVVTGKTGAGSLTIQLSSADQLAVDGLLNKAGTVANDSTSYNLSAKAGWDTGASAFTTQSITVSNVITPAITKVAYNAATGVFTFTGTHLVNAGSANGISLADLSVSSNLGSLNLSSGDTLSKIKTTGFSVTLDSADKAALLHVFNENGTVSSNGTAYKLAALAGWDSDNGIAISSQAVTVSNGVPLLDSVKYNAATGVLTLTGEYLTTKASGYALGHITLLGDGDLKYTLSSGSHVATGTATATSVSIDLSTKDQLAIDGLLNNNGVQSNDGHTYNLSATSGWDSGAATIKTESITVSNVTAPSISSVAYNAKTGVFTVVGVDLTNHGASNGITLKDLSLTGGATGEYTFSSKDTVSNVTASGFTVTLSGADKAVVNAFVNANGTAPTSGNAYEFITSSNWDSDSGAASQHGVTVSGLVSGAAHAVSAEQVSLVGVHENLGLIGIA